MAGYRENQLQSERVQIGGHWYYVCAECRRPMKLGHATVYDVPVPEKGLPGVNDPPQALCDPCYRVQYARIYPKASPIPPQDPAFNPLPGEEAIPWDKVDYKPRPKTDIELFEEALILAKSSGEKPEEVLKQLRQDQQKVAEVSTT